MAPPHCAAGAAQTRRRVLVSAAALLAAAFAPAPARAGDAGEIRIGQTMPYSGVASACGVTGHTGHAYVRKIKADGGISGRKVILISLDDACSPPRTVEQARRLVAQDDVRAVFGSAGAPPNMAAHEYLNGRRTPQLSVSSGATIWNQTEKYPWTIGWQVDYESEVEGRPRGEGISRLHAAACARSARDAWAAYGYTMIQGPVHVLRQAGDDLGRENIMKQARNMRFKPAMPLRGVGARTGGRRQAPLQAMQLARFEDGRRALSGDVINVGDD